VRGRLAAGRPAAAPGLPSWRPELALAPCASAPRHESRAAHARPSPAAAAARSGPFRFDLRGGKWVYARDGRELHKQLQQEIGGLIGAPLQLE
jgi:hypothetical protein